MVAEADDASTATQSEALYQLAELAAAHADEVPGLGDPRRLWRQAIERAPESDAAARARQRLFQPAHARPGSDAPTPPAVAGSGF